MENNKTDWSQYEVKDASPGTDWSQYETKDSSDESPIKESPQPEPQKRGLIDKTMELFSNAMAKGTNFLAEIPDELKGIKNEFKKDPVGEFNHVIEQLGVGTANTAKGIANFGLSGLGTLSDIGGEAMQDFGHSSIRKALKSNEKSKMNRPSHYQIPEDTGLQKALHLESNRKGDKFLTELPEVGSLAFGGGSLLKSAYKSGNNFLKKEAVQLKNAQDIENKLKRSLESAKAETGEAQLNAASDIANQKNNLMKTHEEKAAEVESMIPNEPESFIKRKNVAHFSGVRQNLKSHFDQEYDSFRKGTGSKPITEPLTTQELDSTISILNPNGKRMAEGLIPQEVTLNILNPETKKPFVLNIPAENGSVQDYIEMMRTARDARSKLQRDMGKPSVTRADELQMSKESEALKSLQDNVENKIKSSVYPEEWQKFQSIQKDYKDLYRPFMDNPHLFDAWFNKRDSGKIFEELSQPKYERLFNQLHETPEFNQLALSSALRGKSHPLSDKNPVTQAKKIDQLLEPYNSDINRFMSPEQFASLKTLSTFGNSISDADKALKSLSLSLLNKAKQSHEISKATKLNPKAKTLLSDISKKQLSQKEISSRMKQAGITTDEAKANFEAKKHANEMLKKALSITSVHKILNKL